MGPQTRIDQPRHAAVRALVRHATAAAATLLLLGCTNDYGIAPSTGAASGQAASSGVGGAGEASSSTASSGAASAGGASSVGAGGGGGGGGAPASGGGSGGAPPGQPTCFEQYGTVAGFEPCLETPVLCEFNFDSASATSCQTICAEKGGACEAAFDNEQDVLLCMVKGPSTCMEASFESILCQCTRGCGGGAACPASMSCVGGVCG